MNGDGSGPSKRRKRSASPDDDGLVSPSAGLESPRAGGSGGAGGAASVGLPPTTMLVGGTAASSSSASANRDGQRQQQQQSSQHPKARPYKIRRPNEDVEAYGRELPGCSSVRDYLVEGDLGVGTFGVVTKATKRDVGGTKVAIKRIIMHSVTDGVPITTIREIKILKALSHENVVPVLDMVFEEGNEKTRRGTILMVFPYMDHDLSGLLDNEQVSWTIPLIKLYAKQLLKGTAYMHKNNIIHRDLKAANILINNTGLLKIADFGLARTILGGLSRANNEHGVPEYTNMVVTRWYRPPELLLRFKKYGTSIDIWGIGCILGEMLTKRPILQGNSDQEQLQRIWEMCGLPSHDNFPGWDQHGGCPDDGFENDKDRPGQLMVPPLHIQSHLNWKRRVREDFGRFGNETYADLIDRCLTLDPAKRPTALECLEHEFFNSIPAPARIGSLAHYSASHEAGRKNNRPAPAPRLHYMGQPIPAQYAAWPPPAKFDPSKQHPSDAASNSNGGSSAQGPSTNGAIPIPTLHAQAAPPPGSNGTMQQQPFGGPGQQQQQWDPNNAFPQQAAYGRAPQQVYLSNNQQQGYQQQQPPMGFGGPRPGFRPPPPSGQGLPYDSPGPSNHSGGFPTPQGPSGMHRPGGGPGRPQGPGGGGRARAPIHRAMPTSGVAPGPAGLRLAARPPSFIPGLYEDNRPPPPFRPQQQQPPQQPGHYPPQPPPPPGRPPPSMSAAGGMMSMARPPQQRGGWQSRQ